MTIDYDRIMVDVILQFRRPEIYDKINFLLFCIKDTKQVDDNKSLIKLLKEKKLLNSREINIITQIINKTNVIVLK
jgi:transcriptional regulator CtsR